MTLAISGIITRGRNCYIMDPWRTNKRVFYETAMIEGEEHEAGRRRGRYARHHRGPTIGGIKSAKERWLLAARGAESDEVERNRGAKEADTIHNGLGEPARRSNATLQRELPTSITDVKRRVLRVRSLRASAFCVRCVSSPSKRVSRDDFEYVHSSRFLQNRKF